MGRLSKLEQRVRALSAIKGIGIVATALCEVGTPEDVSAGGECVVVRIYAEDPPEVGARYLSRLEELRKKGHNPLVIFIRKESPRPSPADVAGPTSREVTTTTVRNSL